MAPLVSIIIPTFDRPAYLRQAVISALGQTYPNVEVIIGDNSPNDTLGDWESSLTNDPRLSYRRNSRNLGMSGNFNALADSASGEYLVAIGDDDRLLPEFVSRLMQEMKEGVRLVFCNHYLIDSNGHRLEKETREHTRHYHRDKLTTGVLQNSAAAAWQQAIAISATLMRTADMQRLRFREDLNAPDAEFFIRLAMEGVDFAFVKDYLVEYRVHVANTSGAGLSSERLVEYLLPLEVSPAIEPCKQQLLGPLMMNAVSRCLRQGERERAKSLLRSSYYPRNAPFGSNNSHSPGLTARAKRLRTEVSYKLKVGLQEFCVTLPPAIGVPAYRVLRAAKDWAQP